MIILILGTGGLVVCMQKYLIGGDKLYIKTPKTMQLMEHTVINYGMVETQIEYIAENGLEAWQTKVAEIKAAHPKT